MDVFLGFIFNFLFSFVFCLFAIFFLFFAFVVTSWLLAFILYDLYFWPSDFRYFVYLFLIFLNWYDYYSICICCLFLLPSGPYSLLITQFYCIHFYVWLVFCCYWISVSKSVAAVMLNSLLLPCLLLFTFAIGIVCIIVTFLLPLTSLLLFQFYLLILDSAGRYVHIDFE